MIKSPFGILLAAAGVILAVSPEARKNARKMAVKGTEMLLDLNDKIKARTHGISLENISSRSDDGGHSTMGTLQKE